MVAITTDHRLAEVAHNASLTVKTNPPRHPNTMDLSPVIAWATPLLGVAIAAALGARRAAGKIQSGWFVSLLVALTTAVVIGLVLTFAQVLLLELCISKLKMCPSRGDGNMGYWFQSLFAVPLYLLAWFIAKAARSTGYAESNPVRMAVDSAVTQALQQVRSGQVVSATCPACRVLIRAALLPSAGSGTGNVQTHCACGACKGTYAVIKPGV